MIFLLFVAGVIISLIVIDEILHRLGWHEPMFGQCFATGKRKYHNWEFLGKDSRHCLACHTIEHYVPTYGGIASDGEPWYRWVNESELE